MYDRSYGSNYHPDLSTKEIAAIIRKELRKGTKNPDGPLFGWRVSVRYRTASMSTAIDVSLDAPAGLEARHRWVTPGLDFFDENSPDTVCAECGVQAIAERSAVGRSWWLTAAGREAKALAKDLHSSYNHDGSDTQTDYFDVNYYGSVNVRQDGDYGWKGVAA